MGETCAEVITTLENGRDNTRHQRILALVYHEEKRETFWFKVGSIKTRVMCSCFYLWATKKGKIEYVVFFGGIQLLPSYRSTMSHPWRVQNPHI